MSDISLPPKSATSVSGNRASFTERFFAGRRGRRLKHALTAYALLLPAFLISFVFGLFPLALSAYQSLLTGLNKIVGRYDGLGNYTNKGVGIQFIWKETLILLFMTMIFLLLSMKKYKLRLE